MYYIFGVCLLVQCFNCNAEMGPDPWEEFNVEKNIEDNDFPADLRIPKQVTKVKVETNQCMSDFFFKRLLTIILKGGQKKDNEDNTVDILLHMRYSQEQLKILNEYITSSNPLSEIMLRRSVENINDSIYKPKLIEKIAIAWSQYVYTYFIEYKDYITWGFGFAAVIATLIWLWQYISHQHMLIFVTVALYFYEVLISYKEAEKDSIDKFLSRIEACKWRFWTSHCEVAPPDPIIFLKHMNPLKIAVKMVTTFISEPMLTFSALLNEILDSITGDLFFPLGITVKIILLIIFNALLLFLFISIACNFILNIPFQLNLFRILSIASGQRHSGVTPQKDGQADRIPAESIVDLCSKALSMVQDSQSMAIINSVSSSSLIGRVVKKSPSIRCVRRPKVKSSLKFDLVRRKHVGSGDA